MSEKRLNPSEWTANDFYEREIALLARLKTTRVALVEAEDVFRKLESSEKSMLDSIYMDMRAVHREESNPVLEKFARSSVQYKTFLDGLAAARRIFLKARHDFEMAKDGHESLRSLGAFLREERRGGG